MKTQPANHSAASSNLPVPASNDLSTFLKENPAITHFTIVFSGGGDSGDIDEITFFYGDVEFDGDFDIDHALSYDILSETMDAFDNREWEKDAGGCGELVFCVAHSSGNVYISLDPDSSKVTNHIGESDRLSINDERDFQAISAKNVVITVNNIDSIYATEPNGGGEIALSDEDEEFFKDLALNVMEEQLPDWEFNEGSTSSIVFKVDENGQAVICNETSFINNYFEEGNTVNIARINFMVAGNTLESAEGIDAEALLDSIQGEIVRPALTDPGM